MKAHSVERDPIPEQKHPKTFREHTQEKIREIKKLKVFYQKCAYDSEQDGPLINVQLFSARVGTLIEVLRILEDLE